MQFDTYIGLEVHAELKTRSKIFCICPNKFGSPANTNVCPVCMGFPGARPMLNRQVVLYGVRAGLALDCDIAEFSRMDRKNYFYPDLPKAYQISQAEIPLCSNGHLDILVENQLRRIGIERIHIEEDAGKLVHDNGPDTLIDFNRCGVPLIEVVTRPDMRSSAEAHEFLETLKSVLQFIDVSDCRMEEGSIRCDVNVSLCPAGSSQLGTRVEMKNINSFSSALRAIEYETARQDTLLSAGGIIHQETRKWDDSRGESFVMRTKENVADYRFFPEPDLAAIHITDDIINNERAYIPELPTAKLLRYTTKFGIPHSEASIIAFDAEKAGMFDEAVNCGRCSPRSICNWIIGDITKYLNDSGVGIPDTGITPESLADLGEAVESKVISSSAAKTVLMELLTKGGSVGEIIRRLDLAQNSDTEYITSLVEEIISANQRSVEDYRNGKTNALGYLVGQCMRRSAGKADPVEVKRLLNIKLNNQEDK